MLSMLNERRQVPRYSVKLDIDIILDDGRILPTETLNICEHGIRFLCDSDIANEIEPRGIHNHPLDHLTLKVVSTLPVEDEKKLYAICQVVSARRMSQDEYLIGLEFSDFEKNSEKVLQRYIEKLALDETI